MVTRKSSGLILGPKHVWGSVKILLLSFLCIIFLVALGCGGDPKIQPTKNDNPPVVNNSQATKAPEPANTPGPTQQPTIPNLHIYPKSETGINTIEYFPIKAGGNNSSMIVFVESNNSVVGKKKIIRNYLGQQDIKDGKPVYLVEEKVYRDLTMTGKYELTSTEQEYYSIDDFGNINNAAFQRSISPKGEAKPIRWKSPITQDVYVVGKMELNKEYIIYDDPQQEMQKQRRSLTLIGQTTINIDGANYPCIKILKKTTYYDSPSSEFSIVLTYAKGIGLVGTESTETNKGKIEPKEITQYTVRLN